MEEIRSSAVTMERLVAGYRRLSKLELGASDMEEVRLEELARRACQSAAMAAEIEGEASAWCDRALMDQVFVNLAKNAQAHGVPDTLRFVIGVEDDDVEVRARNGVNQDFAVDDTVFAPFRRLDSAAEGTGLGLAIVCRSVKLHRGRAHASCANRTFEIMLRWPHRMSSARS